MSTVATMVDAMVKRVIDEDAATLEAVVIATLARSLPANVCIVHASKPRWESTTLATEMRYKVIESDDVAELDALRDAAANVLTTCGFHPVWCVNLRRDGRWTLREPG